MASLLLARTSELLKTTLIPHSKIAEHVKCNPKTIQNIRDLTNIPNVELCERIYNFLSRDPLEVK